MTLDDFAAALLVHQTNHSAILPKPTTRDRATNSGYFIAAPLSSRHSPGGGVLSPLTPSTATSSQPTIANFVLAKNLDRAPQAVQIQALELLRTHRIFTRTSVQTAPKQFLFVPVLGAASGGAARVADHLNDFFFVAHWHDPEDGYVNTEEKQDEEEEGAKRQEEEEEEDDTGSASSVLQKSGGGRRNAGRSALITEAVSRAL
jgi:hypothetical protein